MSRLRLLVTALCILLAAAAGVRLWHWCNRPDLPTVNLEDADSSVRLAVEEAMDDVTRSPRRGTTWGRLGMVLLAHAFVEEAAPCLARAERLDPLEPRWPYFLAQTAPGDPAFALACLERAAARAGNYVAPRLKVAEVLLDQGQLDEAEAAFRQEPGNARARLGLARLAFRRGELAESQEALVALSQEVGCKKAARLLLAEVYQRQGEAERAEQERAVAAGLPADLLWPDPFLDEVDRLVVGKQYRLNKVKALAQQGLEAEARALSRQFESEYPDVYWLVEGRLRRKRGDYGAALKAYRKAQELEPEWLEARQELAEVLMAIDRNKDAANELRLLLQREPMHGPGLHALGECERRLGNRPKAIEHLRLAAAVMPGNAGAQRDLGELLLAEGDLAAAVRHLGDAVRLDPRDAKAKELLDQAQRKKGG